MTARNMDEPRTPSLADLMLRMARSSTAGSQHCLPATVTRYDAVKQCVDAQPTIQSERIDEDGTVVADRLPPVLNAPVMFYGSGDYRGQILKFDLYNAPHYEVRVADPSAGSVDIRTWTHNGTNGA